MKLGLPLPTGMALYYDPALSRYLTLSEQLWPQGREFVKIVENNR